MWRLQYLPTPSGILIQDFFYRGFASVLVGKVHSRNDLSLGIKKDFLMVFEPRLIVSCYQICHCHVGQKLLPAGRQKLEEVRCSFPLVTWFLWTNAGPRAPGTDLVLRACMSTSSRVHLYAVSFLALTLSRTQDAGDLCWLDQLPALCSGHGWGYSCVDGPYTGVPLVSQRALCSRCTRQTTKQGVRKMGPALRGLLIEWKW